MDGKITQSNYQPPSFLSKIFKKFRPNELFIPHLSEEIWKKFGGEKLAIEQDWPIVDKSLLVKNFNIAIQINGKTKDVLSATKELDKDSVVNILKENEKISRLLKNKRVIKTIYVSGKIINFVTN